MAFMKMQKNLPAVLSPDWLTPQHRWCILLAYWLLLALALSSGGYLPEHLMKQLSATSSPLPCVAGDGYDGSYWFLHLMGLIVLLPILFAAWEETFICSFGRPLSLFVAIVYPLGQVLDSTVWLAAFDLGRHYLYGKHFLPLEDDSGDSPALPYSVLEFLAGFLVCATFVGLHRATLEQWYLPFHHFPPPDFDLEVRQSIKRFVLVAIFSNVVFCTVYYITSNGPFLIALRYASDCYFCVRMRVPAPWSTDMAGEICRNYIQAKQEGRLTTSSAHYDDFQPSHGLKKTK